MSTAILISGQLRTFAKCWPTQRWHVLRHFADPHFFICVQRDDANVKAIADLDAEYEGRVHLLELTDPDLSAHLTPQLAAAYSFAPYANAAPAHQLLLQHWYSMEVWNFFNRTVRDPEQFSTVIRMRGDNYFHDFTPPARGATFFNQCHTPFFGKFGGVNDRFAVMGEEAAGAYFGVYDKITGLLANGCPFHPETLLRAAVESEGVSLRRDMRAEFSTLRMNGQMRHWTQETLPCDWMSAA